MQVEPAAEHASALVQLLEPTAQRLDTQVQAIAEAQQSFLRQCGLPRAEIRQAVAATLAAHEQTTQRILSHAQDGISAALAHLRLHVNDLIRCTALDGDLHADRLPLMLKTRHGDYVVKYGDTAPWHLLSQAIALVNSETEWPRSWGTGLGWHVREWVVPASAGSDPKAQAHALGELLAVAFHLNLVDLHHENYVVTNRSVVPIDVECTLYAHTSTPLSLDFEMIGFANRWLGVDPVNGKTQFRRYAAPFVERDAVSFIETAETAHHVLRNRQGSILSLGLHLRELLEGFRHANGVMFGSVRPLVEAHCSQGDWLTRYLFRPTAFYRVMLSELQLHPSSSKTTISAERFKFAGKPHCWVNVPIAHYERSQLFKHNIPLFHVGAISGELHCAYSRTPFSLPCSPLAIWRKKQRILQERLGPQGVEKRFAAFIATMFQAA